MEHGHWKDELAEIASNQHGVIERRQLGGLAPSTSAARHELAGHRWEEVVPGVFRLRGSPRTEHQSLSIAVLRAGGGAVISHQTAAALWGLPGYKTTPIHVTRIRNTTRTAASDVIVHEARRLSADQITTLHRLPVTRPERIPFDLANVGVNARRVERAVDGLWSDRLVSGRSLRRVKDSLPTRGFRGTALLRELLEERGDAWVPPASGLESRAMDLFDRNGFAGFERQVDLGASEWVGRVDFVDRTHRIVVEVQSDRHHAALSSQRDDAARFDRLERDGFTVIEVWEDELWHRPEEWLTRLRRATGQKG